MPHKRRRWLASLRSAALAKPVQSQLKVLGDMSLGGTIVQVRNLAESTQVAFDAGGQTHPAADVERDGHPLPCRVSCLPSSRLGFWFRIRWMLRSRWGLSEAG